MVLHCTSKVIKHEYNRFKINNDKKHQWFEHMNKHKFIHYFFYIKILLVANYWNIYIYIYSRVNYKLPIYVLVRYYFATYGLKNVTLPT